MVKMAQLEGKVELVLLGIPDLRVLTVKMEVPVRPARPVSRDRREIVVNRLITRLKAKKVKLATPGLSVNRVQWDPQEGR